MTLHVDAVTRTGTFLLTARFTLPTGLTVLFGPSGSGKTRLLRLLAGLDRPEAGTVRLGGTVFDDVTTGVHLAAHERRIGMVFQDPYLLPHRSVLANVALAVRGSDRDVRRRRATELLGQVGAGAFAPRRPRELSGGQRQRVALARALAGEPELLLLDEPFNALDAQGRDASRTLVRELVVATRVPTLFVTHDHAELAVLADHVLSARDGHVDFEHPGTSRAASDGEPPVRATQP
jgi:ABC-type sulfate/molybdate transport systems ATPase subunit